jgi:hypothetical protein
MTTQLHWPPGDKLWADNPVSPAGIAPDAKMRSLADVHPWGKSHLLGVGVYAHLETRRQGWGRVIVHRWGWLYFACLPH